LTESKTRNIVAIGHLTLKVSDLKRSITFYRDLLGLKHVVKSDFFNAFELDGHTHLCIMPGKPNPGQTAFDFLARNVDEVHQTLKQNKVQVTDLKDDERSGHRIFEFSDPDGHKIQVLSHTHESLSSTG